MSVPGQPVACCIASLDSTTTQSSVAGQQCNSSNNNFAACNSQLQNYCLGNDVDDMVAKWTRRPNDLPYSPLCPLFMNRFAYGVSRESNIMVPQTSIAAESFMYNVLSKYTSKYPLGVAQGQEGYTPMQDVLYRYCSDSPGLCDRFLTNYCVGIDASRLDLRPGLANWCGCHLDQSQYSRYVNVLGAQPKCTPYCNRTDTIQRSTSDLLQPDDCRSTTCIIDNVTINLASSNVSAVNFGQMCGSCEGAACTCEIQGFNFTSVQSQIPGSLDLKQYCKVGSTCTVNGQQIDCAAAFTETAGASPWRTIIVIGIIIAVVMILWIVASVFSSPSRPSTKRRLGPKTTSSVPSSPKQRSAQSQQPR